MQQIKEIFILFMFNINKIDDTAVVDDDLVYCGIPDAPPDSAGLGLAGK